MRIRAIIAGDLGCILPRVPANHRAGRWNAECIAIATRELDRLDGYATAQASAADAAAKAAAEHGEAVGASGTAVVSTAACRRSFSLGCVFTPIARCCRAGACGSSAARRWRWRALCRSRSRWRRWRRWRGNRPRRRRTMCCSLTAVRRPSLPVLLWPLVSIFSQASDRLLVGRRGPCPRPSSGPSGCPGHARRRGHVTRAPSEGGHSLPRSACALSGPQAWNAWR